jgi:hypothetical protein
MSQSPATGPPETGLPRPSTTRFILLILMICAGSSFAAYWWLVAGHGFWITEQSRCLTWLGGARSAISDVGGFNGCVTSIALRQESVVLLGPVTMIMVGVVITAASVPLMLWFWGSRKPSPRLTECFESCLREIGVRRKPRLITPRRGARGGARVFGLYPRYWVLADPLRTAAAPDAKLAVVLRHELAHLRLGDVDRTRLARSIWGAYFVLVAPALTLSIAEQGGRAWVEVGSRLLIMMALIHLTYRSLLRAREHEADLLADAAQSRSHPDTSSPTLTTVLAEQERKDRNLRRWRPPTFLLAHPVPAERIAVLDRPQLAARLSAAEFVSIGIAAGFIFQELAFAVGAVLPAAPEAAYWITGAVVAVPVCVVAITALWRHELAGPGPLSRRAVLIAGALLGAALLAGSQLSPRAAANWSSVQLTVSSVLPSDLVLTSAGPLADAALAFAVIAGSALFMLWALTVARELAAASRHRSPAGQRRIATILAVAVLALPLGTWFLLCRLAGNNAVDPAAAPAADLLQGQLLLLGLVTTAAVALVPFLVIASLRRGRAARRHAVSLALISGAVAALVPFGAWCAGAVVRSLAAPGPPIVAAGNTGPLPLLPASVAAGNGPIGAGIMCWTLGNTPPQDLTSPATWRVLGGLLERTPDQPLKLLGGELIRAARAPAASALPVATSAWIAAGFRCNILLSTPSASDTPGRG